MIPFVFVVSQELTNHILGDDAARAEVRFRKHLVDRVRDFAARLGGAVRAHPRIVVVTIQASECGRIDARELGSLCANDLLIVFVRVRQKFTECDKWR